MLFSTCSGNPSEAIEKYLQNARGLPLVHYLKACDQLGAEWTSANHYGPPQPGDIRCRAMVLEDKARVKTKQVRLSQFHQNLKDRRLTPEKALIWCRNNAPDVETREDLTLAAGMRRLAHMDPPLSLKGDANDADKWRIEHAPEMDSIRGQG